LPDNQSNTQIHTLAVYSGLQKWFRVTQEAAFMLGEEAEARNWLE
jgi:hypothetical protein